SHNQCVTTQTIKRPSAVPPITTIEPSRLCRKGKGLGCDGLRSEGASIQRPQSSSASRSTAGTLTQRHGLLIGTPTPKSRVGVAPGLRRGSVSLACASGATGAAGSEATYSRPACFKNAAAFALFRLEVPWVFALLLGFSLSLAVTFTLQQLQ